MPYALDSFVLDLDRITRNGMNPAAIVGQVAPLLQELLKNPGCIPPQFRQRGASAYGRYMLHRVPNFNITAVVWGPGDMAKAHNHETWGLVGVLENEIRETRFRRVDDGSNPGYAKLELKEVLENRGGMVSCLLPPDDEIHEMENTTQRNTVEVHVYGRDLTGLKRLRFDVEKNTAATFSSPKYDNC